MEKWLFGAIIVIGSYSAVTNGTSAVKHFSNQRMAIKMNEVERSYRARPDWTTQAVTYAHHACLKEKGIEPSRVPQIVHDLMIEASMIPIRTSHLPKLERTRRREKQMEAMQRRFFSAVSHASPARLAALDEWSEAISDDPVAHGRCMVLNTVDRIAAEGG